METLYFSIDSKSRSQCEKLNKKYRQGKLIGKGAYGKVYEVCLKEDCKYVLKVIKFDNSIYEMSGVESLSFKSFQEKWIQEVEMHMSMQKCETDFGSRFIPHLYDAWFCSEKEYSKNNDQMDAYFYMVIEKFDGTLFNFIDKFKRYSSLVQKLVNTIIKDTIIQKLKMALEHVHNNCNICINDIKMDNILYREDKATFTFVFSDFGISNQCTHNSDDKCKLEDNRRLENTIQLFLKELQIDL